MLYPITICEQHLSIYLVLVQKLEQFMEALDIFEHRTFTNKISITFSIRTYDKSSHRGFTKD